MPYGVSTASSPPPSESATGEQPASLDDTWASVRAAASAFAQRPVRTPARRRDRVGHKLSNETTETQERKDYVSVIKDTALEARKVFLVNRLDRIMQELRVDFQRMDARIMAKDQLDGSSLPEFKEECSKHDHVEPFSSYTSDFVRGSNVRVEKSANDVQSLKRYSQNDRSTEKPNQRGSDSLSERNGSDDAVLSFKGRSILQADDYFPDFRQESVRGVVGPMKEASKLLSACKSVQYANSDKSSFLSIYNLTSERLGKLRSAAHGASLQARKEIFGVRAVNEEYKRGNSSLNYRQCGKERGRKVVLGKVEGPPRYDAWVPVKSCHWIGPHMPFEPYMPYFGDTEEDRSKVFNLYQDLLHDNDCHVDELSDMEVDSNNAFEEPVDEEEWAIYVSLDASVERAAVRYALEAVTKLYGRDDTCIQTVSQVLNVRPVRRIRRILDIMANREKEWRLRSGEERKRFNLKVQVSDYCRNPSLHPPPSGTVKGPGEYFCRSCMIFGCERHAGQQVNTLSKIADPRAEQRSRVWALGERKGLRPCGVHCALQGEASLSKRASEEEYDWSELEQTLAVDAMDIFDKDTCGIARVVGSKSCRQVYNFLKAYSANCHMSGSSDVADCEVSRKKRKTARKTKKNRSSLGKSVPVKADMRDESEQMEKDFIPCDHPGECRAEVCRCIQKGIRCEAFCGCNSTRWSLTAPGHRFGDLCKNRHGGCDCENGRCETDNCACWRTNRACDPDLCNHCGANLPKSVSLSESDRRCQNMDVILCKRKKTFVGTSEVHGLGLFAGETFYKGDLVGVYLGQTLDTDIADTVGRIYEAKDHTFFFDLTESLVVDGGPFGAKSKFVNHRPAVDGMSNCSSRMVRVRGEPHIALYARKTIEPGSEFAFDYQFTNVVPEWAKPPDNRQSMDSTVTDTPNPDMD